jgi:hypothetical protein
MEGTPRQAEVSHGGFLGAIGMMNPIFVAWTLSILLLEFLTDLFFSKSDKGKNTNGGI